MSLGCAHLEPLLQHPFLDLSPGLMFRSFDKIQKTYTIRNGQSGHRRLQNPQGLPAKIPHKFRTNCQDHPNLEKS